MRANPYDTANPVPLLARITGVVDRRTVGVRGRADHEKAKEIVVSLLISARAEEALGMETIHWGLQIGRRPI